MPFDPQLAEFVMAHVCSGIKTSRILFHFLLVFHFYVDLKRNRKNPLNRNGIVRVLGRHGNFRISSQVKNHILHLIRVCGPHRDFCSPHIATGEKKNDAMIFCDYEKWENTVSSCMQCRCTSHPIFRRFFHFVRSFRIVTEKMPLKIYLYCLQSVRSLFQSADCACCSCLSVVSLLPILFMLFFFHLLFDSSSFTKSKIHCAAAYGDLRIVFFLWFQPKESILEEVWKYLSLGCPFLRCAPGCSI